MRSLPLAVTSVVAAVSTLAPGCGAPGSLEPESTVADGVTPRADGTFDPDATAGCSRTLAEHHAKNPWLGAATGAEQVTPDGGRVLELTGGTLALNLRV